MEQDKINALRDVMRLIKRRQFMLDKLRILEAPESVIQMSEMMINEAKQQYAALLDDQPVPDDIGSVIYDADILSWSHRLIEEYLQRDRCETLFRKITDHSVDLMERLIASKGLGAEWHKAHDDEDFDRVFQMRSLIDTEFGNEELFGLINEWKGALMDALAHYLCFHASWHK